MDALDFIGGGGFPHGRLLVRERARAVTDRYSKKPVDADWNDPMLLELPGAHIATSSSTTVDGEARSTTTTVRQLVLTDPTADVREGDRIRDTDGKRWRVTGDPATDPSPFTGWRPTLVADLERVTG